MIRKAPDYSNMKILSNREVESMLGLHPKDYPILKIERDYKKELKTNLVIPSFNQNFSCAVEFMTKWFYNKFPDDFFKSKYIESSNILEQANRLTRKDMLTIAKPAAMIRASIQDISYNRDQLNTHNYGALTYTNRARYKDAFFFDRDKHLFISIAMEAMKANFTFKMMLPYQGINFDIAKSCTLWFRAGGSEKHYLDMDFHVPNELLEQLAADIGLKNLCPYSGKIIDAVEFCHYFNQRSRLMLEYKFNSGTGTMQYFLKVPHCWFHIKTGEVQTDEGMRQGHLMNNYTITFDSEVDFVCPKFYAYYSFTQYDLIRSISRLDKNSFIVQNTSLAKIPNTNEKGWPWATRTEYNFNSDKDIADIKAKKLMHINFSELLAADLRAAIDMTKAIAISPSVFLDIWVYNGFKVVKTSIDWQTYTINILEPITSMKCHLIIYMDNEYFHEQVTNFKQYSKDRQSLSYTNIEHKRLDYKKNLKRASLERLQDKVKDTDIHMDSSSSDNPSDTNYPDGCLYYENLKKNGNT